MEYNEKRKVTAVTLKTKKIALESIENGDSTTKVAKSVGVAESTVRHWKRQKVSLDEWHQKCRNLGATRNNNPRMRNPVNKTLDEAMWIWFSQQRDFGVPLSGPILRMQALKFNAALGENPSFKASEGWLNRWKDRHGVRQLTICGEKLSADDAAATEYLDKFRDIILKEQLVRDQVFNCDETGLNYKMLPSKTLVSGLEKEAPGFKKNKERLTVLACSNASGTLKLPLTVVGKSANPRAFKNIRNLPVIWRSQPSAWMTVSLFTEWFYETFVPLVTTFLTEKGLPIKALLVMDNCSTHPKDLAHGDIRVEFLPPNVTSLIQPMDQGILECLKKKYRQKLMLSILENTGNQTNVIVYMKTITVKDVVFWLATVWEDMDSEVLHKFWQKLWPREDSAVKHLPQDQYIETLDSQQLHQFCEGLQNTEDLQDIVYEDVVQWINYPTIQRSEELLNDEEILSIAVENNKENNCDENYNEECSSESMCCEECCNIGYNEAKLELEKVIKLCESDTQLLIPSADTLALHRVRDKIALTILQQTNDGETERLKV